MSNQSILISIVLMIAIGVGVVWYVSDSDSTELGNTTGEDLVLEPSGTVTKRAPFAEPRTPPSGQAEYRNEFHRFQLLYPDSLIVAEEKVAAGTTLITFESGTTEQSFQIFIVPHGDSHITDHRLQEDLPSPVIESREDIMVAGAEGMAFISSDPSIGPTREVWFIKNGFLYEVTTSEANEAWLSEILTNWMFL